MKLIVASLCTVLLTSTVVTANHELAGAMERRREIKEKCAKESGIESNQIKTIMREGNMEEMKKLGCFFACSLQEWGAMVDNVIDTTKMFEGLSKILEGREELEKLQGTIEDCKAKANGTEDRCEMALAFHTCMHENLPLRGMGKHFRHHDDDEEHPDESE